MPQVLWQGAQALLVWAKQRSDIMLQCSRQQGQSQHKRCNALVDFDTVSATSNYCSAVVAGQAASRYRFVALRSQRYHTVLSNYCSAVL